MRDRYEAGMADELLRAFHSPRRARPLHSKGWAGHDDIMVQRLFDGAPRLTAAEAVLKGLAISVEYDPRGIGEHLAWAVECGIADFSEASGLPVWTLLRHGVTFLPHKGTVVDTRAAGPRIGGLTTAGAISRETKRRARLGVEYFNHVLLHARSELRRADRSTVLPDELKTADLPPVDTVGDLVDNLDGFVLHLPLYRVQQLWLQATRLPTAPADAPEQSDASELDDFHL